MEEENKTQESIIQEYMQYCEMLGIIDSTNRQNILKRLSNTEIKYVTGRPYGGCTTHDGDKILVEICKDQIEKESISSGINFKKSLDENIFHELTHASSILDEEIETKVKKIFTNIPNSKFPNIDKYGYTILNEFVAQSIAQKIVTAKYQDIYEKSEQKPKRVFAYNENGYSSDSLSYEYESDLNFYGEIEEFALKFIESLYGERDINKFYKEHFSGQILDCVEKEFRKRKGGIENLYLMFGNMSNIIIGDYYQQGYFGSDKHSNWSNLEQFTNSINEFNSIVEFEINRCKTFNSGNLGTPGDSNNMAASSSKDEDLVR